MRLSIFECVFVQIMTVSTCVFEGAPAGMCMWKAQVYTRWPPLSLYPLYFHFWDRISCWTWALSFHLEWLASKHPESSCVCLSALGLQPISSSFFWGCCICKGPQSYMINTLFTEPSSQSSNDFWRYQKISKCFIVFFLYILMIENIRLRITPPIR